MPAMVGMSGTFVGASGETVEDIGDRALVRSGYDDARPMNWAGHRSA